ncbi:MAG: hypothetical protein WC505_07080 [Patescibacteria group bacterium]
MYTKKYIFERLDELLTTALHYHYLATTQAQSAQHYKRYWQDEKTMNLLLVARIMRHSATISSSAKLKCVKKVEQQLRRENTGRIQDAREHFGKVFPGETTLNPTKQDIDAFWREVNDKMAGAVADFEA